MLPQIIKTTLLALLALTATGHCVASRPDAIAGISTPVCYGLVTPDAEALRESLPDSIGPTVAPSARPARISLYALPYSLTTNQPDWRRLWINTAIFAGAFSGTLAVLECLPEGATNWNRAAIQQTPPFKRWYRNIFVRNPEIDGDNAIFNYVLHPYAGAVYFMSARGAGFNFWRSLLYSACISTIGWEFGIEAFMERPSYQDIFITPLAGALVGELFYKLKRNIVSHDYRLGGSRVLGNVVAFLIDPVNEIVGLFDGNEARRLHLGTKPRVTSSLTPTFIGGRPGFAFTCTF